MRAIVCVCIGRGCKCQQCERESGYFKIHSHLQCVAVCCCSVLQCVAVCCSVFKMHSILPTARLHVYSARESGWVCAIVCMCVYAATHCSTLQHTAAHPATPCDILQHTATHLLAHSFRQGIRNKDPKPMQLTHAPPLPPPLLPLFTTTSIPHTLTTHNPLKRLPFTFFRETNPPPPCVTPSPTPRKPT